jgi:hypothetical protein
MRAAAFHRSRRCRAQSTDLARGAEALRLTRLPFEAARSVGSTMNHRCRAAADSSTRRAQSFEGFLSAWLQRGAPEGDSDSLARRSTSLTLSKRLELSVVVAP